MAAPLLAQKGFPVATPTPAAVPVPTVSTPASGTTPTPTPGIVVTPPGGLRQLRIMVPPGMVQLRADGTLEWVSDSSKVVVDICSAPGGMRMCYRLRMVQETPAP